MEEKDLFKRLRDEVRGELLTNILPFWMRKMPDESFGGFYGRMSGTGELDKKAPKGAILTSRILWTFSAAYRVLQDPELIGFAARAREYLATYFVDSVNGGVYWSINHDNTPLDTKKQIYTLGFAIYGLSEFYRATGDPEALDYAKDLFNAIERWSFDSRKNGYFEAFTREWNEIKDMRLSEKDENERKTMNTHLHILEPYANLYRAWKDPMLERQLRNLIGLFLDKILDKEAGHLNLFFDDDWNNRRRIISYGHDIEASWLLHEAALVLGDPGTLALVEPAVKRIAEASREGLTTDGAMIYENIVDRGTLDTDRHWWVQAENIVGNVNLYQHFGDTSALRRAVDCWEFVKANIVDRQGGEWFWSVKADGSVNTTDDKAGFWKCPYHNGRMCLEIIERASQMGIE